MFVFHFPASPLKTGSKAFASVPLSHPLSIKSCYDYRCVGSVGEPDMSVVTSSPGNPVTTGYEKSDAQNTADNNARSVFEELDRRRSSAEYEYATMIMTIHNARGRTRTRELSTWNVNRDEATKQLIFFESPADVRGTGLLTVTENGTETQRIYLPAVGRVQTIGASQRSDRFMGSDFTYEDLGQQDPDQFDFTELDRNSERILLEAIPRRNSQYERIHFYIDPNRYLLLEAEYFNPEGKVFKRLELHDYSNIIDELWRPGLMVMFDLENGRKTELLWTDRTLNEPIPDDYFTDRQLRRGNPR